MLLKNGVSNKEVDSFNVLKESIKNFYNITEEDFPEIFRSYHLHSTNLCREKDDGTKIYFGAHKIQNVINEVQLFKNALKRINTTQLQLGYLNLFDVSLVIRLSLDILDNSAQFEHVSHVLHRFQKRKSEINKVFNICDNSFLSDIDNHFFSISLKDVNTEMKKIIPLIIFKKSYESHKTDENTETLHLIIDEAHNVLSEESSRENISWKDYRLEVIEEIIKEGRKFGVFVTIASQRPSDISNTLISQLHNTFIHRLINEHDLKTMSRTISFLDKTSYDSLSILPQGGCIFTGTATESPIALQIPLLEDINQPKSTTVELDKLWFNE
ncbi:ATP-binding protein [Rossellomorea vietnamensis]|uniref:ATP-binding protein n=1 Tax=Rossellomorea vietnamensis TaxID=218284 RepID=UPI003CF4B4AB